MTVSPMSKNILIAGAGPVGLTAALELARRGFTPRIIDKAADFAPLTESRALAIHLRTLAIFEPSGISETLRAAGNLITKMRFMDNGKYFAQIDLSEHPRTDAAILSLGQGHTERVIAKALRTHNITPEWNTELLTAENTQDGVKITIRNPDGTETTENYDLLIGCDGAHSCVRKSAEFTFEGQSMPSEWTLLDAVYKTPFDPHIAHANFITGIGAFGGIPINDHTVRYVGRHPDIEDLVLNRDNIKEIIWRSHFKVSYRMVSRFHRGHIFLAGDAAHIHSPAGGKGMNLGIEDAATLAWMISEGTENTYSDTRLPIARKTLKSTKAQTKQITNTSKSAAFLRTRILPLALRFKFIRRKILESVLALDTPAPKWLEKKE